MSAGGVVPESLAQVFCVRLGDLNCAQPAQDNGPHSGGLLHLEQSVYIERHKIYARNADVH